MSGLIAIVGRPNVGKSALFNRIIRKRIAIVHDQPGVTRDRISAEAEWRGQPYTLVDTGGIGLVRGEKATDVIIQAAFDQVQLAIESAHAIILVVNVQEGVVALDREVAIRLRASGKPVLVAVNKVDTYRAEDSMNEFAELGFEKFFPVSAIHGEGIEPLMIAATSHLPKFDQPEVPAEDAPILTDPDGQPLPPPPKPLGPLKIAIVGRPNAGKSSIINTLTNSERVIVSPIPGTTRDSVDVPFEVVTDGQRQSYILIDTAGLRKARRVADSIEFFSAKRSEEAIMRSDLTVLVLDAESGITEQDKKIADLIVTNRKACIVVVNKWDLVEKGVREAREEELERRRQKKHSEGTEKPLTMLGEFGSWVQDHLFFLDYAPVIFTSAQSGFNLDRLLEAIRYVAAQLQQKIPTGLLNRTLQDAVETRQPVSAAGHRLKFFYATQVRLAPPTFLIFVNRDELFSPQYLKNLTDKMRTAFGYEGCPILLVPKARPKTIQPLRKWDKPPKRHAARFEEREAARADRRSGGRTAPKPSPQRGPRADPRDEARPGRRTDSRPGSKFKPEHDPRSGPRADAKPGRRSDAKPGLKPTFERGPRSDQRAEVRPGRRSEVGPRPKPPSEHGPRPTKQRQLPIGRRRPKVRRKRLSGKGRAANR